MNELAKYSKTYKIKILRFCNKKGGVSNELINKIIFSILSDNPSKNQIRDLYNITEHPAAYRMLFFDDSFEDAINTDLEGY